MEFAPRSLSEHEAQIKIREIEVVMNWSLHIEKLKTGSEASFRPKGNSMQGKIENGQLVTISPNISDLKKGDVVFCKVKGNHYVHLLTAIDGERHQISNNKGHVNGWVGKNCIFGIVTKVEP